MLASAAVGDASAGRLTYATFVVEGQRTRDPTRSKTPDTAPVLSGVNVALQETWEVHGPPERRFSTRVAEPITRR